MASSSEADPKFIAFYGSLMTSFGAQKDLGVEGDFEFVGVCRMSGRLFDLGEYPGVIESERPEDTVIGELYRIKVPRGIKVLDEYEGIERETPETSPFVRRVVRLVEPATESWMYFYQWPVTAEQQVASGDWAAHVASRGKHR